MIFFLCRTILNNISVKLNSPKFDDDDERFPCLLPHWLSIKHFPPDRWSWHLHNFKKQHKTACCIFYCTVRWLDISLTVLICQNGIHVNIVDSSRSSRSRVYVLLDDNLDKLLSAVNWRSKRQLLWSGRETEEHFSMQKQLRYLDNRWRC